MNLKSVLSDVKDAIRYLWSPLLMLWIAFSLLILASSCSTGEEPVKNCGTFATIKDLRGLDGCTYVLELDNGERLEPVNIQRCDPSHSGAEHFLSEIPMLDGKKVTISWIELPDRVSACMAGKIVEITCIAEVAEDAPRTSL